MSAPQEFEMPSELAEIRRLRTALRAIKDVAYQKDQDEITRINDMYDIAERALRTA